VITQLGVMGFEEETKEMSLLSVHPGVTREQVQENTSFDLHVGSDVAVTEEPTREELRLLREEIDPARIVIGR
jgi:acyl CoA:acetate/3-ketoacid CoA transferase beta subunit